jgi:hypothetical protein
MFNYHLGKCNRVELANEIALFKNLVKEMKAENVQNIKEILSLKIAVEELTAEQSRLLDVIRESDARVAELEEYCTENQYQDHIVPSLSITATAYKADGTEFELKKDHVLVIGNDAFAQVPYSHAEAQLVYKPDKKKRRK